MIHFLRFFYRNLKRNKTFSITAVSGFTLSLTIALLLSAFVFHEFSYDKFHRNINRIYRLADQTGLSSLNEDIIDPLQKEYPEIESVCRYNIYDGTIVYKNAPAKVKKVLHTESSFFDIFDVEFLNGTPETALNIKESVILSEDISQRIFGVEDPIGKTLTFNHEYNLIVTGVVKEFPGSSSLQPEIIIHRDLRTNYEGSTNNGVETFYNRFFVLLNPNTDPDDLSRKLSSNLKKQNLIENDLMLLPFKNSYLNTMTAGSHLKHSNILLIVILGSIALIILVISALNFIILFSAHHLTRLKEIGLKRTIGLSAGKIFSQFLFEAVLICFLSFIISIVSAELLHPYFEQIVSKSFPISAALQFPNIIYLIAGVIITALISGWYPGLLVSRIKPGAVFRSGSSTGAAFKIKSGLLTVQYAVTIILAVSLFVITKQIDFIKNKDLGFDSEQIIRLNVHWKISSKLPILKQELMKHSHISYVASSNGLPGKIHCWTSWNEGQKDGVWKDPVPWIPVDYNFFNVFDTPIIHGRNFRSFEDDAVIMNETAWKTIGRSPLQERYFRGKRVIGIVKDIHYADMHQKIVPAFFVLDNESHTYLTLRILPGDTEGTISYIKKVWQETVPDFVLDLKFYDDWIHESYKNEEHLAYAIRLFAVIAIVIACLGTFGVIQFMTSRRTKEIGIRKVSGAKTSQIILLLNIEFIKWVSLAFILAVPLSWAVMKFWLQFFAYRAAMEWWMFALAGVIVLLIALITVSGQAVKAAAADPVKALRYE